VGAPCPPRKETVKPATATTARTRPCNTGLRARCWPPGRGRGVRGVGLSAGAFNALRGRRERGRSVPLIALVPPRHAESAGNRCGHYTHALRNANPERGIMAPRLA
jgi:hypothetical protein